MCREVAKMGERRTGPRGRTVASALPCAYSEEPGMLRSRLVLATFLVVTCAACGGRGATSGPPSSESPTATAPSTPTPSVPSELAGYSPDERAAYVDAVTAYDAYSRRSTAIFGATDMAIFAPESSLM